MTRLKEDLLKWLDTQTQQFTFAPPFEPFTAQEMAKHFNVKRNTISHYLNQLIDENNVIKITTRPVIFLSRQSFCKSFYPINTTIFDSIQALQQSKTIQIDDVFSSLIGAKGSLKKVIRQLKSALFYPDNGLPIMLYGETGVGKSMLAKFFWQYAKDQNIIEHDAPFIAFNCAQYAHNPELLSSLLFGYVKGAFTGAEKNTLGMIEKANKGVLFLDEVHRLSPESQEKLFTFMDYGTIRQMGESDHEYHVNVRLIFATTETPENTFLDTFCRRIPLTIYIPSIQERHEYEKKMLIFTFLQQEASLLQSEIHITPAMISILMAQHYKGNIGQLHNLLKSVCATLYSQQRGGKCLNIQPDNHPSEFNLTISPAFSSQPFEAPIIIHRHSDLNQLCDTNTPFIRLIKSTFEQVLMLFTSKSANLEQQSTQIINHLLDKLIFDYHNQQHSALLNHAIQTLQMIVQQLEQNHQLQFNGNLLLSVAYYFYYKKSIQLHWQPEQLQQFQQLNQYLKENYPQILAVALELCQLLKNKLDIDSEQDDVILLTLYFISITTFDNASQVKAIILAHGYATASSIANVANRILNKNLFDSFDMPLDISVDDIARNIEKMVLKHNISKGLVLLVDMGSLTEIYSQFTHSIHVPIAIINNISTPLALYVGELLSQHIELEQLVKYLESYPQNQYKLIYSNTVKPKVIITFCVSGMAASRHLKRLIEDSLSPEMNIDVMALEYAQLADAPFVDSLHQRYELIACIGTTLPPISSIPYLSLEELMQGQGERTLHSIFHRQFSNDLIEKVNNNLIRNVSLERIIESITILDTHKLLEYIEQSLLLLETLLSTKLTNSKKICLYIHISCMLERLIRQNPVSAHCHQQQLEQLYPRQFTAIEQAFKHIESVYNIRIPLNEIGYLIDIINLN